jgi:polyvinyl alcohol dehydrogenase (cytochrome)
LGDNFNLAQNTGGHVFGVSRADGRLLWITQVDSHPAAQVTANPVVVGNRVIVGVASNEEADAASASYQCCTFRGSVLALDASSGRILWKTYTVPANSGPCTQQVPVDPEPGLRLRRRRA